eukprot:TRINITY_DN9_c0_g2_i2.p1 TRINITY_DN9_c0_g2~~TRINITY_DN9_c0_g2_i2.p1  ORF type:complete len:154 (+),score=47.39 TRINITY_DN9_c0_g2_i2:50-511(+)
MSAAPAASALPVDPQKLLKVLVFDKPNDEAKKYIRLATVGLLGVQGVLGVLMPGLILGFWGAGFFPRSAVTDIFQAVAVAFLALAYVYFKSEGWDSKAQTDVMTAIGGLFAVLAVWDLLIIKFGYELGFLIFFHLPINAALAFLHAKQLGLVM